jgi:hypothetical protein
MLTNKRDALVSLRPIRLPEMCLRFAHTHDWMQ